MFYSRAAYGPPPKRKFGGGPVTLVSTGSGPHGLEEQQLQIKFSLTRCFNSASIKFNIVHDGFKFLLLA